MLRCCGVARGRGGVRPCHIVLSTIETQSFPRPASSRSVWRAPVLECYRSSHHGRWVHTRYIYCRYIYCSRNSRTAAVCRVLLGWRTGGWIAGYNTTATSGCYLHTPSTYIHEHLHCVGGKALNIKTPTLYQTSCSYFKHIMSIHLHSLRWCDIGV